MNINKLYFGKDDAERDITSNGLLKVGFLKTSMYEIAKQGSKSLVIGRKGSGKSAICLMLDNNFSNNESTYSCVITPDAISADEIRRFELIGVNNEQAKKLVWRYIFLVHIAKFIIELHSKGKINVDDIDKVRNFLISNGEMTDLTFQEKFWKIINRIKATFTLSAFGQEVELSSNEAPNEGIKLESKMEFVEKYLKDIIKNLSSHKLYLLVDKVDEIWNNDSWSDTMVISLLKAIKEINEAFPSVNCIVFLRQDIYELLNFHDRDKFRGDEIQLSWTNDTLEELILARANASMGMSVSIKDFWKNLFPEIIEGEQSAKYILDRTLKRPRDIIQFCNLCRDNAKIANHLKIEINDVIQATDRYSDWKLNDLIVEWKVNYPFLNDLFIIFSNSSYVVPRNRFEKLYGQIKSTLENRYSDVAQHLSEDSILNILYVIGFLGIERNGNINFYYDNPHNVETRDKLFVVHPAFRNALKSVTSTNVKSFENEVESNRHIAEISRSRNVTRGFFESIRSSYGFVDRLLFSIKDLKQIVLNETLPKDVEKEIFKNIDNITMELFEQRANPNFVNFEITRMNCYKYFDNLRMRLQDSDFLQPKSNLDFALDKILSELWKMRNLISEEF